ncbi:TonB-dependent receptor [Maribacter litoralis]|uniref:Iron complex outermembrane recepter protein n=1 Tax=Maribacter litoralis TaxID=2059726 RepID=A0A653WGG5_9FLAO|nr:TonB-dependent receptor [Maribacter litoralis]VXC17999.1 Iron complex outermembrane recepter protein [Maribacter litoralis]
MKYYLYVFAIFCSTLIYAQDCNSILLGEIVDFHDNSPLSGATINITGKDYTATSKENGKFSIKQLCDGIIELEISHPECTTKFVTLTINGDTYSEIRLEHHLEELKEVKVVGDVPKNTNSGQENILSVKDIEQNSGKSLGDALKKIAGVSTLNTGGNIVKPVIQGLNGSRILILNNNVRMQDMEWGEEHAPNVDVNANQNISVIKGAAAIEYGGDAIGGVIVLEPLPIVRTDSLFGKTQLNLASNGRGGNITSSLTKSYKSGLYIKGQGSYKRLGDLEAPDYILSNTGIKESGASLSIGKRDFIQGWEGYYSYFNSEIGILRASHIGNIDDLITAINSDVPSVINDFTYDIDQPYQEVTHHLGKLSYYRRFEGFGKWTTQYDFQQNRRFEYDVRVGDDADKASLDLKLTTHSILTNIKFDAKQGLDFKVGALGRYQTNFANPDTGVRRLIPDYDKYDFGLFAIGSYELNNDWTLDAGARYDFSRIDAKKFYRTSRWEERGYDVDFSDIILEDLGTQLLTNPVFDYHNFSGTLGFHYEINGKDHLRFNYAYAQRAPNPSELFSDGLHHSAARIELGDLRIKSETSSKFSASLERNTNKWGYTVAPFLNSINDFILVEPTGVEFTIRGAFPVWSYRQTDAVLLGVDASLYNNWSSGIRTDHKFAWVRGTDTETDTPLIHIPAANFTNSISYTNPRWNNFLISLESQYVFEQTRYPENIEVYSPEQQENVILDINTPPDAYHLLALNTEASFTLKNKNDLTIGLSATNLLNTNYRDYLNRQRYFADDMGRNINLRLIFNY